MEPELSVIVTTHDRCELLRKCLESLMSQSAAGVFEVVVVVDGSTDATEEMLAALEPSFPMTVVVQPRAGQSAARNTGAARSRGRILLFIDDDEVASASLAERHIAAHEAQEGIAAFGVIHREVAVDADRLARLRADVARAHNEDLSTRPLTFLEAYGGNSSLARTTFDAVGGYAEDLERETDFEFGYRLHRAGARFVFLPDAAVTEYRTRPWRRILVDVELRGRISIDLYRRHPALVAELALGGSESWPRWWLASRSLLLSTRPPPSLLGGVGFALPHRWSKRWFGYVWNYAHWRGARAAMDPELRGRTKRGTAILRYHAFGEGGEAPSRYVVPERRFARQLGWLRRRHYNVISLAEYVAYRQRHEFPPAKSVVLTFDDGYLDNVNVARPILQHHGFPATVFLITSPTRRNEGATDPRLVDRPLLGLEDVETMREEWLELGAHTRTHPDLTALERTAAEREIVGSKVDLERVAGVRPRSFAYPFGASNPEVRRIVEQAGFESACGSSPGHNWPATDAFDLRRIEVRGTDSLLRFALMLVVGEFGRRRG